MIHSKGAPVFHRVAPLLIAVTGVVVTLFVAWRVHVLNETRDRLQFQHTATQLADAIGTRVEIYIALLRSAGTVLQNPEYRGVQAFRDYVKSLGLTEHYPGIQGIGFAQRVEPGRAAALIQSRRRTDWPDFHIWPAPGDETAFPIVLLEPVDRRNLKAIGFDMYSEPVRHEAMARAWLTGQPAASGKVTLVQEIDENKQAGFLVYLPVHMRSNPNTAQPDKPEVIGLVYSPFRVDDLFAGIFGQWPADSIQFAVFDGPVISSESLLHKSVGWVTEEDPRQVIEMHRKIAGQAWTIVFASRAGITEAANPAVWAGAVGALLTALLALLVHNLERERSKSERSESRIAELNESLEERVLMRTAELEDANRQLESFSYSVSHDLRAPARHVLGFAELLKKQLSDSENPNTRRLVGVITDSAGRMACLIDDLLAFSRTSRQELRREPVAMNRLVEDARQGLAPEIGSRRIDWQIRPLPDVEGDRALLTQVWTNLLSNAVKYTRGREVARITVGASFAKQGPAFFVEDNGSGFDMRYAHKLFGVFQRLHREEEFEGTGIGLANVARIIHRHGGRIWAEGRPGAGATFYFSLPRPDAHSEKPSPAQA